MRHALAVPLLLTTLAAPASAQRPAADVSEVAAAVGDQRRPAADRARDRYRNPAQTLAFFGLRPDQTVVEYSPGAGWYTKILAPLVKDGGKYMALASNPRAAENATKMLSANEQWFGPAQVATLDAAGGTSTLAPGAADVVLTFRNVHNLIMGGDGNAAGAFKAFYAALKPGGTLGVVDHRLPEDRDAALEKTSGYVKRSTVVRLAEGAGFKLAGESEINANPRDSADYPKGVWTLPPALREGDADRARYLAIGESDRMTLKFVKPAE